MRESSSKSSTMRRRRSALRKMMSVKRAPAAASWSAPPCSVSAAESERKRKGHRDRAKGEQEGKVHDVVGNAHCAQAHGDHQPEDGDAGNAREAFRVRGVRAPDDPVGYVGQPGSDDQDHGAEKHVAAESDEERDQVANLSEVQPIRRLRGREQHGDDQHEQRYKTRRWHTAGKHIGKSELLGKRVEPHGRQQAREGLPQIWPRSR